MLTEKNVFLRLDTDSSPLLKPNGTATDMVNVRVTETGDYTIQGNLERATAYELPEGVNKTLHALEDRQGDRIIYFLYNSLGSHRIVLYNPAAFTAETILEWNGLDFQETDHIESAIIDNTLIFLIKGRGEIKQLDITKKAEYDAVKAADPLFINLIKRMPVMPLELVGREPNGAGVSQISEVAVQATYQYVYADNQVSRWSPFSDISLVPYVNASGLRRIKFLLPVTPEIPAFVTKIKFGARLNNSGDIYVFEIREAADFANPVYFYNNNFIEIIPAADAIALFDAVPPSAQTLTIARNRVEIAGYPEGYDAFNSLNVAFTRNFVDQDNIEYGERFFKTNSAYRLGFEAKDFAGRTFGVITKPEWVFATNWEIGFDGEIFLNNRFLKEESGFWSGFLKTVTAEITGTVPDWVHSLQPCISKSQSHDFFIQGFGYILQDAGFWDDARIYSQLPQIGKHTYVVIKSLTARKVGYTFEEGDYLNIHTKDGDLGIFTAHSIPILGQKGQWLEIPTDAFTQYGLIANGYDSELINNNEFDDPNDDGYYSAGEPLAANPDTDTTIFHNGNYQYGVVFEIFRPAKNQTEYYEVGKPILVSSPTISESITLKGDVTLIQNFERNDWEYTQGVLYKDDASQRQNWLVADLATPGLLGSTVWFPYLEAMSPWDKVYSIWSRELGKPTAVVPDAKQVYKKSFIRFSNKYVSGTKLNGLNTFEALNEKELPVENGAINKLTIASNAQAEGTVLLAIQQNETESVYLGEMQWRDTQGNTTTAISDQVLGSNNTLRGGFGTINPESVVADGNGSVYWWDATKGEVVRYAANGLTPLALTYRMQAFFRELSRKQLPLKEHIKVFGGFDPVSREYIMHFAQYGQPEDANYFAPVTIAFSEKMQGFTSRYDYHPEYFAKSNTLFFTFKNGKIWQHEAGAATNVFYGQFYPSQIRFISNQEPHLVKIWNAIAIEGQQVWVPKEMTNEAGQLSYMKADWFANREGVFYGAIRRDTKGKTGDAGVIELNNGEPLRSAYLDILLENNTAGLVPVRLDAVNVIYTGSTGHQSIN